MSKVKFSKKTVEKLKKNPYVKKVSENGITYTEEFKTIFIKEHLEGIPTSIIFERYGFDVNALGEARIYSASKRWRQQAKRDEDFTDKRVVRSGRPLSRELSEEETIERLKHKIAILEQENSFLKKVHLIELQAKKKVQHEKNTN